MKRVRMLTDHVVDGLTYRCDQVVDFPTSIAKDIVNLGAADASKEAVAFALEANDGKVLVHATEAVRAAELAVTQAEADLAAAVARLETETDAALRDAAGEAAEAAKLKLQEAHEALAAARG